MRPDTRAALPPMRQGDAFLAGGTWLFSEPQPTLRRLIDLSALDWTALEITAPDGGLEIAATCRLAELERFAAPADWPAAGLFRQCVHALWGSFKIHNAATVGGNLCLALPAGPIAALGTALDGECRIWTPAGGTRTLPARDFVTGDGRNALRPGEVLRALRLTPAALRQTFAFRQHSLTRHGRSAALLIGTRVAGYPGMRLTLTACVRAPIRLDFDIVPDAAALSRTLACALHDDVLHDDVHGAAAWKRRIAFGLAEEIRQELSG